MKVRNMRNIICSAISAMAVASFANSCSQGQGNGGQNEGSMVQNGKGVTTVNSRKRASTVNSGKGATANHTEKDYDEMVAKVDALYESLTLEERVAQVYGIRPDVIMENGKLSLEKCREVIPYGVGHICQYACSLDMDADELREFVRGVQEYLQKETRMGIPAVFHDESITGIAAKGATVYPQQLGVACSWDRPLAMLKTQETAKTMRELGCELALSPMVDVILTAHWPRIEESYGEDGYLSAEMGAAFVKGLQSGKIADRANLEKAWAEIGNESDLRNGVAATTKHFLGYGGANTLSWKEIYEEVLFPHEVIIREVGSKSLMTCYDKFREDYAVSSETLIQGILRDYLGFDGTVVSDYNSTTHSSNENTPEFLKQCAAEAIMAGNDIELPDNSTYRYLPELLADGTVSEEAFEKAVKNALMMKARLGLLDENPVLCSEGPIDLDPKEHRATAYKMASESIVLLKNNGVLPLAGVPAKAAADGKAGSAKKRNGSAKATDSSSGASASTGASTNNGPRKKIAVVGPNANTYWCMLGDYTFQSMQAFWQRNVVDPSCLPIPTLFEALSSRTGYDVNYARGCDWSTADEVKIAQNGDPRAAYLTGKLLESADRTVWSEAIDLAKNSDVVIAALGENPALCGENRVRKGIRLPGDQEQFLKDLIATGKPVVLVMFGGRPQVIDEVAEGCAAILQAWYPGEEGGNAVADIISGTVNPSAKLSVTYPKTENTDLFSYTNDTKKELVAYPFGFGLSYTTYEYSDIKVQSKARTTSDYIKVSCTVSNTGTVAGDEVVQLYMSPASGQPLKPLQLKGFDRISLKSGESKKVEFMVPVDLMAWWSEDGWTTSEGQYRFRIGPSSAELPLEGICTLTGKAKIQKIRNNYLTKVK